jgi:IclR family acetate operon transcriptional repressor
MTERPTTAAAASSRPPVPRRAGVERVLLVFRALAAYPNGVTLDALAAELGLAKSSVHRALQALRKAGFVEQDRLGPYRFSMEVVRLIHDFYDGIDVRGVVVPALRALTARFGATSHFAQLAGREVVYIAKVDAQDQGVRMTSVVGGRNPAHSTGVGKALLAGELRSLEAVEHYVDEFGPLEQRTPQTLVTAEKLWSDLELTRRRGYAIDDRESEELINCVAFPVHLVSSGRPTGAISVSSLWMTLPLVELVSRAAEIRETIDSFLGSVTPANGYRE